MKKLIGLILIAIISSCNNEESIVCTISKHYTRQDSYGYIQYYTELYCTDNNSYTEAGIDYYRIRIDTTILYKVPKTKTK